MVRVAVVGAGASGLYLSRNLALRGYVVTLLEASFRVGGRWKTLKNGKEAGAWRLGLDGQHPLSVKVVRQYSRVVPINYNVEGFVGRVSKPKLDSQSCPSGIGLSVRDWRTLTSGASNARKSDLRSGYHGEDRGDCAVSEVYGVKSSGKEHVESENGKYGVVLEGFEGVARKMAKAATESGVNLLLGHRVTGFDKYNRLSVVARNGHNSHREFVTEPYDWLVWCVPPHSLPYSGVGNDSNQHLLAASAISSPLVHVFAPLPKGYKNTFKIKTDMSISQIICHRPDQGFWQPAYASGKDAQYLTRLYQADKKMFSLELRKQCGKVLKRILPEQETSRLLQTLKNPKTLLAAHWEQAIHMWAPAWGATPEERYLLACRPSPVRRPRVCYCGESLSLHQGWAEGAFQTADHVLNNIILKHQIPKPLFTGTWIKYRGIPLRLDTGWMSKHPGGKAPLRNHLKEEVSDLWEGLHSSTRARQQLFSLLAAS